MSTTTKKFVGTLGGRKFKKHSYLDAFRELLDTIVAARLKEAKPSDYVLAEEVMSETYHEGDTITLTLVYRRVTE